MQTLTRTSIAEQLHSLRVELANQRAEAEQLSRLADRELEDGNVARAMGYYMQALGTFTATAEHGEEVCRLLAQAEADRLNSGAHQ